jgi:hypothetical protein
MNFLPLPLEEVYNGEIATDLVIYTLPKGYWSDE